MPDDGRANRNLPESIVAIEQGCNKYLSKEYMDPYIDSKIKTAFELAVLTQNQTGGSSGYKENPTGVRKFPILECKSIANLGTLSDAKTYRSFNRKMKNAMDQVRPASREVLEILDLIKFLISIKKHKLKNSRQTIRLNLWALQILKKSRISN